MAFIFGALLVAMMFVGCGTNPDNGEKSNGVQGQANAEDIGEGDTSFAFQVIGEDGNTKTWTVHTNADTVGAALAEVGLIEGKDTEMGVMIIQVNGQRADFDLDGAFWAFYIDGEFASDGVYETEIASGKLYALIYTKA
jgi:hypothetical protein